MPYRHVRTRVLALVGAIVLGVSLLAGGVAAQEATPSPAATNSANNYPVAIHQGTCEKPVAQAAWDIANAKPIGEGSDNVDHLGTQTAQTVFEADHTVDAKLNDVASSPYVIAVHASPEKYGTIVACGVVAGPKVDGKLVVALSPVSGSAVNGIAILDEDTSGVLGIGKDQIKVTVYLTDANATTGGATPAA